MGEGEDAGGAEDGAGGVGGKEAAEAEKEEVLEEELLGEGPEDIAPVASEEGFGRWGEVEGVDVGGEGECGGGEKGDGEEDEGGVGARPPNGRASYSTRK